MILRGEHPWLPKMSEAERRKSIAEQDWRLGFVSGATKGPITPPPEVADYLAYAGGYSEGRAAFARALAARRSG
jgi:hypothetical protein